MSPQAGGAVYLRHRQAFLALELDQKIEEPIVTKEKEAQEKSFYGIKNKKGFYPKGYGNTVTVEYFFISKNRIAQHVVRDIYWYDFTATRLRRTSTFDPKKGKLLHGEYRKMQGTVLLEEGIFFKAPTRTLDAVQSFGPG